MPKVKDLGITVVPEQFRPAEIGAGGGCGRTWCGPVTFCTDCTTQPFSICGTTPGPGAQQAMGCTDCTQQQFSICGTTRGPSGAMGGCTDCTTQAFSICGTTRGGAPSAGGGGCTDCTTQQFSICGTTPGPCTDCTTQQFSICGTTWQGCTDCTTKPFSICGTTFCTDCTTQAFSICGTTRGPVACRLQSRFPTVLDVTTPCGGSMDPTILQQGGLRLEDIAQLKEALQNQIKALEEHEKTLGPQTVEEIDAREQKLNEELSKLKSLRSELGKKK